MKTLKIKLSILFLFIISNSLAQEKLNYENLKHKLIDFLVVEKEISSTNAAKYKDGTYNAFNFFGVINLSKQKELKNGLYYFSIGSDHGFEYYVLVEGDNYSIFNIKSQEELNKSLSQIIDFGLRNKLCYEFVNRYCERVISTYFNRNKNPTAGFDVNCERGIKSKSELP